MSSSVIGSLTVLLSLAISVLTGIDSRVQAGIKTSLTILRALLTVLLGLTVSLLGLTVSLLTSMNASI